MDFLGPIFGVCCSISFICFYWMMSITATEYKDDGYIHGFKSFNFLFDFRKYTRTLKDKKKIRKHNLIWLFFILPVPLFVLFALSCLVWSY